MELVYGEGLPRQEKQFFLEPILVTDIFQALYARLLELYPAFPSVDFAIDDVYRLAAETKSVHLLKQQALEGQPFLLVVLPLQPLAKTLDVALEPLHCHCLGLPAGKRRIRYRLESLHQSRIDLAQIRSSDFSVDLMYRRLSG